MHVLDGDGGEIAEQRGSAGVRDAKLAKLVERGDALADEDRPDDGAVAHASRAERLPDASQALGERARRDASRGERRGRRPNHGASLRDSNDFHATGPGNSCELRDEDALGEERAGGGRFAASHGDFDRRREIARDFDADDVAGASGAPLEPASEVDAKVVDVGSPCGLEREERDAVLGFADDRANAGSRGEQALERLGHVAKHVARRATFDVDRHQDARPLERWEQAHRKAEEREQSDRCERRGRDDGRDGPLEREADHRGLLSSTSFTTMPSDTRSAPLTMTRSPAATPASIATRPSVRPPTVIGTLRARPSPPVVF